jgi:hypothetical protein
VHETLPCRAAEPPPSLLPCRRQNPSNMANSAPPTRKAVHQALASFVKLALGAPSVKGNKEVELFDRSLPVALGKFCTASKEHASGGTASTRFVVDEIAQQGLYSALAGVGDLLLASPKRLFIPRSTVEVLPAIVKEGTLWMIKEKDGGKGWEAGLHLYSMCIEACLGASVCALARTAACTRCLPMHDAQTSRYLPIQDARPSP